MCLDSLNCGVNITYVKQDKKKCGIRFLQVENGKNQKIFKFELMALISTNFHKIQLKIRLTHVYLIFTRWEHLNRYYTLKFSLFLRAKMDVFSHIAQYYFGGREFVVAQKPSDII